MSAADYQASINGCIGRTQISRETIGPNTFVSEADIDEWLEEHASDVDGFIGSVLGQTVSSLSTSAKRQFKRYIEMMAAAELLRRLGSGGTQRITNLEEQAASIMERFEAAPERIDGTKSNDVFTTSPDTRNSKTRTPDTFIGDNYEGF